MYSESQKKATVKYLATLKDIRFRVKEEEYKIMEEAAKKAGFTCMRQFYLQAIKEKIENINKSIDI